MNYMTRPSEQDEGQKYLVVGSGLPDFSWYILYQNGGKIPNATKLLNGQRIYQVAVKYSKWPFK
jgi:hypothetical protein